MRIYHTDSFIAVTFAAPLRTLSSAVYGGGYGRNDIIVNIKTDAEALNTTGPERLINDFFERIFPGRRGIGLLTAASMKNAQFVYRQEKGIQVLSIATAGTSNALNISERSTTGFSGTEVGTINTIVITDAFLLEDCMVSTAITATEAKTAALIEYGVKSTITGNQATGTGTDSITIASGNGTRLRYAGGHTLFGQMVGETVCNAVMRSLQKKDPEPDLSEISANFDL